MWSEVTLNWNEGTRVNLMEQEMNDEKKFTEEKNTGFSFIFHFILSDWLISIRVIRIPRNNYTTTTMMTIKRRRKRDDEEVFRVLKFYNFIIAGDKQWTTT